MPLAIRAGAGVDPIPDSAVAKTKPAAAPPEPALPREGRDALVCRTDTHIQLEAGAGSGKTTWLVDKLMTELGFHATLRAEPTLDLTQIVAITFTRKAAAELKERLRQAILARAHAATGQARERWAERAFRLDQVLIGTIDSFAARLVEDYGALAGLPTGYTMLETGDATALHLEVAEQALLEGLARQDAGATFLVKQCGYLRARTFVCEAFKRADLLLDLVAREALPDTHPQALRWSRIPGLTLTAADRLLEPHSRAALRFLGTAHARLSARMTQDGVRDFAHVLLDARRLAATPRVQAAFRDKIKLVCVDEHQDTNKTQVDLLFDLVGLPPAGAAPADGTAPTTPGTRLVLVGDPKQGIYSFRSADITMWKYSMERMLAAGGTLATLRENYRTRPTVLRFLDVALKAVLNTPEPGGAQRGARYGVRYLGLEAQRPEGAGLGVEFLYQQDGGAAGTAEIVAERIADMLRHPDLYPVHVPGPEGTETTRPVRARDIAIVAKELRHVAELYERALRERGVGCYTTGGKGLFARPEVQDLAHALQAIADPTDVFALLAFLRSPIGGLDDLTLAELAQAVPGRAATFADALAQAPVLVEDPDRAARAADCARRLQAWHALRDRLPHADLLELVLTESGYRTVLAGAPDAPTGLRNLDKLLRLAREAAREPLVGFVRALAARVRRADFEEEAPIYSPEDDLVTISTIHSAKGLEWPYVILVGTDDPVARKPFGDLPALSSELGVALPTTIVLADRAAADAALEESATWRWHTQDTMLRNYAEAKRVCYVACTRARDRLILAGESDVGRDGTVFQPFSLQGALDKLQWDSMDKWFRFLFGGIATGAKKLPYGPALARVDGTASKDVAVVRRGLPEMAPATKRAGGAGLRLDTADARAWPAVTPALVAAAHATPAAPAPAALADLTARSVIRAEFTASELLTYLRCAWKHKWGYRENVSSPVIEAQTDDAAVNRILPSLRGTIVHDTLQGWQATWTEAEEKAALRAALLKHLPMAEAEADTNVDELYVHVHHYRHSTLATRLAQAAERHYEDPFVMLLDDEVGSIIPGAIDVRFRDKKGWHLADYKAGLFRTHEDVDQAAMVDERVADYEIQTAVYVTAAERVLGVGAVKTFTFLFTGPGEERTIKITKKMRARWATLIGQTIRAIRAGEYGAAPVYREKVCKNCELLRLCRPEGAPVPAALAPAAPPAAAA